MRAVDTNLLIRLVTRDDAGQAGEADDFVAKGASVSILALAEATWVLRSVYKLDAVSLATTIKMLLDHEHLTVQDLPLGTFDRVLGKIVGTQKL